MWLMPILFLILSYSCPYSVSFLFAVCQYSRWRVLWSRDLGALCRFSSRREMGEFCGCSNAEGEPLPSGVDVFGEGVLSMGEGVLAMGAVVDLIILRESTITVLLLCLAITEGRCHRPRRPPVLNMANLPLPVGSQ